MITYLFSGLPRPTFYAARDLAHEAGGPYRAPHRTISLAALLGDASRPGEVSYAHAGALLVEGALDWGPKLSELRRVLLAGVSRGRAFAYPAAPHVLLLTCAPSEVEAVRAVFPDLIHVVIS